MTLPVSDDRMLKLMKWAVDKGFARTESAFLGLIGFSRTNISHVKRGNQSFNKDHIVNACKLTGANANWILGLENEMFRKPTKDPITRIKEAVVELEAMERPKPKKKAATRSATT